LIFILLKLQLF